MKKKVLSEQLLFSGKVSMPNGFEINLEKLSKNILDSLITKSEFKISKNWDMLNTYIIENINLKYGLRLENKKMWGNVYRPKERTHTLLEADPFDLKNSPDYTLLYGVDVENCFIKISYDDNRFKGEGYDIELKNNMFIIFPSTNTYTISNKQTENLNLIHTIVYNEYK
tara:strand:+ start:232 stop:738 length:507 start_codon:yes stop_codon:yes gene_type:complete